jgi:hypothetical protein
VYRAAATDMMIKPGCTKERHKNQQHQPMVPYLQTVPGGLKVSGGHSSESPLHTCVLMGATATPHRLVRFTTRSCGSVLPCCMHSLGYHMC